ncbi:Telomeric repeat-binding factor like [Quillaja saponaria]|uniref:Telomeric repeat-binding factor like n=1 Tax=Quillaja saponaria TaxID=32244 RepID=A0AAD7PQC0_QUISA|nr:Telomeric repeat-binding factor like [Quillaja saponaria]
MAKVIPVSNSDLRLKKTLLLRTIQTEVSKGSVTENILEILEFIEELDRIDGIEVMDTMKGAYCAVAVECTVKYLEAFPYNEGKYLDAVQRIWRGRTEKMETSAEGSHLVSDELKDWRDEIEAAVWDARVGKRLAKMHARKDALDTVKDFLAEAWAIMGPSFLELAASLTKVTDLQSSLDSGVRDENGEVMVDRPYACDDVGASDRIDFSAGPMDDVEGKTVSSPSRSRDSGASVRDEWGIFALPLSIMAPQGTSHNQVDEQVEEKAVPSAHESQKLGACGSTAQKDKGMQKGPVLRRKHTACHRRCRGVKITSSDEVGANGSCRKYYSLPSAEVKRVQETLKSSSLELQDLVEDPLSRALQISDTVRSELARKDMKHEPTIENQSRDVDAPNPHAKKGDHVEIHVANLGNQSSVQQSNVLQSSLMQRNSTAHTYEWDDSIDDSPERIPIHLSSPRTCNVSPLNKYETTRIRKRRKRWSSLEEDTLRNGVKKFGKGNWKVILNCYRDIFNERTEVDLKDKWRNMTR